VKLAGAFRRRVETLKAVRHSVVTERTTYPARLPQLGRRADLNVRPSETATDTGIEVHEEEWSTVTAQRVYKMRCDCGRSWFELELLKFVECPACHKLGLVSHLGQI
jgi:hypothetical protein